MRNAGTKKSWMTSSEIMRSWTACPSGTCSSLISRRPFGCWIFHIHWRPVTQYWAAPAGGRFWSKKTFVPHPNRMRRRPSGMTDQTSSRICDFGFVS